jgi:hypothetical protein
VCCCGLRCRPGATSPVSIYPSQGQSTVFASCPPLQTCRVPPPRVGRHALWHFVCMRFTALRLFSRRDGKLELVRVLMRALPAGIPDPYLASIPVAMLPKLMASGSSTSHAVTKPAGGRKARHSVERRTVSQVTTSHVLRPPPGVCGAGTAALPLVRMGRCLCFPRLRAADPGKPSPDVPRAARR